MSPPPIPQEQTAKRLHPLTLFFIGWDAVRGWLIPVVILLVVGRLEAFFFYLLIFVLLQVVMALARYFTFTYRIAGNELITRQGIVSRQERHIPLERVQDIKLEQGVLHRILKTAVVRVETASGQGAEASLSVLSLKEAESLRARIFEGRAQAAGPADETVAEQPEVIRKLAVRDLVLAGLTSNRTASVMALFAAAWAFADDLLPPEMYGRMETGFLAWVERLSSLDLQTTAGLFVAGIVAVFVVSAVISVIGSILLFHGFTLSRKGEDLHRSYGLLTRRSSSLPRRRIQVLQIEEGLLRRLLNLATLRADTAGPVEQGGEQAGRDVLLPIVPRAEAGQLLSVFFPDIETAGLEWRKVSRIAIRRGTIKGAMALAVMTVALYFYSGAGAFWVWALLPLIFAVNVVHYRKLGYALGPEYFHTRRGWRKRSTHIVPIRNIQSVLVTQTPFDRRLGLATLTVDTAGQTYTGGGPRIGNVPLREAEELARLLAQGAARRRYRW